MSLLPFAEPHLIDPFEALEGRNRRLACVVEASSRRAHVRRFRSQLLILLLEMSCPPHVRPRRRWYVPGAVARVGASGLRRAWRGFYGEEPMTERTFRSHLTALEQCLAIIRAPGDWLPMLRDPERPERRPRYADTIHVLESDSAALWWAGEGRALLEACPSARFNPDRWREQFQEWRARARFRQAHLQFGDASPSDANASPPRGVEGNGGPRPASSTAPIPSGALQPAPPRRPSGRRSAPTSGEDHGAGPVPIGEVLFGPWGRAPAEARACSWKRNPPAASRALARIVALEASALDTFDVLRGVGVDLRGRNATAMIADSGRLRASAALLAVALRRGDRIRNAAAWVLRAWRFAEPRELLDAVAWCDRQTREGRHEGLGSEDGVGRQR